MLKILLIILLVAIYVAVSYWLIAKEGFNTAREYAQYLVQDAGISVEAIRNKHGEQGVRVFIVLYSIIIVLLAPIVTAWVVIEDLFKKK